MNYVLRPTKDDILHFGKGHDDSPPGRGSGRYPWGSGKSGQKVKRKDYRVGDKGDFHEATYIKGKDKLTSMGFRKDNVTEKDLDKAAEFILNNKQKIKENAIKAIVNDFSEDNMRSMNLLDENGKVSDKHLNDVLDIHSVWVTKFGSNITGEISVYEKDNLRDIYLGGHSLDMDISLTDPNYIPKWVAMNG